MTRCGINLLSNCARFECLVVVHCNRRVDGFIYGQIWKKTHNFFVCFDILYCIFCYFVALMDD